MALNKFKSAVKQQMLKARHYYDARLGGSCLMLLYHRVADLQTDPQQLAVHPQLFNEQMLFLKLNYNVLRIDEVAWHLNTKTKLPDKSVVISFDDGYADNYLEALPILELHHLPAVFYIATATLDTNAEFWWDEMERLLLLSKLPDTAQFEMHGLKLDLNDFEINRYKKYETVLPILRKTAPEQRQEIINALQQIFGNKTRATHRALTHYELRQFAKSKYVTIGAHTHNHPSLAALDYNLQLLEVEISKKILEDLLKQRIQHFSYPFGTKQDYNTNTLTICNQLQFKSVAANYPYIIHKNSDIFQLPRFLVRNWQLTAFKQQLHFFTTCR
ncbi:MAG TPA: polysaccharide deacetylase family protein [Bacteroidia bacterium]|nr:polysaccharide deacetylase family protein [Bacteroidia bacterium]